jgi:hypothetical protein
LDLYNVRLTPFFALNRDVLSLIVGEAEVAVDAEERVFGKKKAVFVS